MSDDIAEALRRRPEPRNPDIHVVSGSGARRARQTSGPERALPGRPYFVPRPAVISVSGGRTSACMLRHILDAHGGRLPDDIAVVFANTGMERPETLDFRHHLAIIERRRKVKELTIRKRRLAHRQQAA